MPDRPFDTDRNGMRRDPETVACLARTRSAVLNVLLFIGAGIAVSGWGLGRHRAGEGSLWGMTLSRREAMGTLLILIFASFCLIRVGSGREALRPPATRAWRFWRARVGAAIVAGSAIPLGFVAGWVNDPRLEALAPYWIAALGLGFLAVPRGYELDDFDEPIEPPPARDPSRP